MKTTIEKIDELNFDELEQLYKSEMKWVQNRKLKCEEFEYLSKKIRSVRFEFLISLAENCKDIDTLRTLGQLAIDSFTKLSIKELEDLFRISEVYKSAID